MENNNESYIQKLILNATEALAKIPDFVTAKRWPVFFSIIAIVVFLSGGISLLRMEQSMDQFFDQTDKSTAIYREFRNKFGSDESLILLYKPENGDLFSRQTLEKVKQFEDEVNRLRTDSASPLNRITRIRSIVTADYLETNGDTMVSRKFIGDNLPNNAAESARYKKLALAHKDYPGSFFSKDLQYGLITITTDFGTRLAKDFKAKTAESGADEFDFGNETSSTGGEKIDNSEKYEQLQPMDYEPTVTALRELMKKYGWSPMMKQYGMNYLPEEGKEMTYLLAGSPWIMEFVTYLTMHDMPIMMLGSLLITFIMLAVSFRSISAMVWPFVIIVFSWLSTFGLIGYLGIPGSTMTSIVAFLILTLGIASSVHILSGFKIFIIEGATKQEALTIAYKKSGFSIILASLTTMGGLFALTLMPMVPIRNFGITATLGILIALLLTLFLLPILLSFWSPYNNPDTENLKINPLELKFQRLLDAIYNITTRRSYLIMAFFAVLFIVSMSVINRIRIDTSFKEMATRGSGITETYEIIDDSFGGANSIELMIDTGKTEGVRSAAVFSAMENFTKRVLDSQKDFVPRAFSLVSPVKESHRILTNGREENYKIPDNDKKLGQVLVMYDSADPSSRRLMVDDDWRTARISFQVYTKSSYEYNQLMKEFEAYKAEYFGPLQNELPDLKVVVTGGIPLMMNVLDFISYSQLRSFALALLVVSLILFLIYGSIRFGIIAIIPNLVPMGVIVGLAGWLGFHLDTDTLIVMPLAIGIVVDDTIHFLTHYRAELLRGATAKEAIQVSLREVGQAMMFTSLILAGGFMIFAAFNYKPFIKFGVLSSGAIFSALLADLFLLPALLLKFYPETVAKKDSMRSGIYSKVQMAIVVGMFAAAMFFLAAPNFATGELKNEKQAKAIAYEMINRDDGRSGYNETKLITCSYTVEDGKNKCSSAPRIKVFESISKDTGKSRKDSIGLSILIDPPSEKNVAFLQKDYDEEGKDSEQWIFLPAMKKMKRVVAESENGPKTGSVFGSEFSYEDIEKIHVSDYRYSLIGEEKLEGEEVYVMESFPQKRRAPKTSYSRSLMWVSKQSLFPLKTELYNKQNRLVKTLYTRDIVKKEGIWIARKMIVVNHKTNRMSLMQVTKIALNFDVDDNLYTLRALTDLAYRERLLKPIREQAR